MILLEREQYAPQVDSERSVVVVSFGLQRGEIEPAGNDLVQAALYQEGMTADQTEKAHGLRGAAERRTIAAVQFLDLIEGEVFEGDARADVERRLVKVRDEKMGLARIGDSEGQALPGARRIESALVVPGAEQAENLAGEARGKDAIDFV